MSKIWQIVNYTTLYIQVCISKNPCKTNRLKSPGIEDFWKGLNFMWSLFFWQRKWIFKLKKSLFDICQQGRQINNQNQPETRKALPVKLCLYNTFHESLKNPAKINTILRNPIHSDLIACV